MTVAQTPPINQLITPIQSTSLDPDVVRPLDSRRDASHSRLSAFMDFFSLLLARRFPSRICRSIVTRSACFSALDRRLAVARNFISFQMHRVLRARFANVRCRCVNVSSPIAHERRYIDARKREGRGARARGAISTGRVSRSSLFQKSGDEVYLIGD